MRTDFLLYWGKNLSRAVFPPNMSVTMCIILYTGLFASILRACQSVVTGGGSLILSNFKNRGV